MIVLPPPQPDPLRQAISDVEKLRARTPTPPPMSAEARRVAVVLAAATEGKIRR